MGLINFSLASLEKVYIATAVRVGTTSATVTSLQQSCSRTINWDKASGVLQAKRSPAEHALLGFHVYTRLSTPPRGLSDVRLISADVLNPPPSMDNTHWYSISAAHMQSYIHTIPTHKHGHQRTVHGGMNVSTNLIW